MSNRALAIGSIYDVTTGISVSVIKESVWAFFARSIFIVPSVVILHAVFICFYLLSVSLSFVVFARDSIYAIARICYRNSVRLSVCHTGDSCKNG